MKRKIFITFLIIVLSLIFLTGAKSSLLTKEEYASEIVELEEDITELEEAIEQIKNQMKEYEAQYSQLEKELTDQLTKEDMYDWLNQCNIYNVRSNVKITAKFYNKSFGFETSSKSYSGNGFIFCASGNIKYVLTTYYLIEDTNYDYVSFKLHDAFQTEYTAKLYKSNKEYGIAILYFTDTGQNDLYVAPLATSDPNVNDPICNIYSLNNSAYNHMNFSKVNSYTSSSHSSFNLMKNEIDTTSAIYGCMSVDLKGNVVGMVLETTTENGMYCNSVPVSKIREYLLSAGFTFN